ncbi:hypothetical protein [Streptomyces cucumeris]|uniref:hypothetical protein n=1 Tax=Streptomyces cucumeris TaxID=2962890 RepID=UPI003D707309
MTSTLTPPPPPAATVSGGLLRTRRELVVARGRNAGLTDGGGTGKGDGNDN